MGLSDRDAVVADAVLGPSHRLTRALTRKLALARQLLVALATLATALAAVAIHLRWGPLLAGAAGVVSVGFALAVAAARGSVRERARGLLITEEGPILLAAVVRERRRLGSRKERERLARSLERLLRDARRWSEILPRFRPLPGVQNLRHAGQEVEAVVALLRSERADVRGVALVARLLSDGASSPLYGNDARLLREELGRIRFVLARGAEPEAVHDRRAA